MCYPRFMTLKEAIETNQLQLFIQLEEAKGVGPVNIADLETAIELLARDQT